jgi:hypothetical protein
MNVKYNNADGGTNGSYVSLIGTGGFSGNPFNTIYGVGPTYDSTNATGTFAYRYPATATPSYMSWDLWSSSRIGGRVELYMTGWSDPSNQIMPFFSIQSDLSSGNRLFFWTDHTGKLIVWEATSTAFITSAAGALPLNTWFRIEWDITLTNPGSYDVRIYPDRTTTTPSYTFANASKTWAIGSASTADHFFLGTDVGPISPDPGYWLDSIQINDTGFPGPYTSQPYTAYMDTFGALKIATQTVPKLPKAVSPPTTTRLKLHSTSRSYRSADVRYCRACWLAGGSRSSSDTFGEAHSRTCWVAGR